MGVDLTAISYSGLEGVTEGVYVVRAVFDVFSLTTPFRDNNFVKSFSLNMMSYCCSNLKNNLRWYVSR